ncbi:hypothetical protein GQ299_001377 [Salmonella enterica subsp. enterica serovar Newport]|nr:hypothetical protein [Salmonella enterica subsp. enterica serovar Newport]EAV5534134.1 hypothetical protein [Salmonella enterica]EBU6756246.1 hypothetical protein [Salmonella enterica subsp. enterica serovar Hadar]EDB3011832.1 hypothetical protein [Salmonella enterica subsp. enterica serovar Typhimurium]EAA5497390.1 hypothetical protein [Salmonella enterica subsp. enterica serovar Newport]
MAHIVGICLSGVCLSLKSAKTNICKVLIVIHLT